eukprot:scaffold34741_cov63-Phaeocystis_antarctica.AAC.6
MSPRCPCGVHPSTQTYSPCKLPCVRSARYAPRIRVRVRVGVGVRVRVRVGVGVGVRVRVRVAPLRKAVPREAATTNEGEAAMGWRESSAAGGMVSEIVSGCEMAYAARAGRATRSCVSLSRSRCAWLSAGRTTAFQPAGSFCAERSPAMKPCVCAPGVRPMTGSHTSPVRVTVKLCAA